MPRVIVFVHGGVIQGARSDMADVRLEVLDYDNLEAAKDDPAFQEEYKELVALEQEYEQLPNAVY